MTDQHASPTIPNLLLVFKQIDFLRAVGVHVPSRPSAPHGLFVADIENPTEEQRITDQAFQQALANWAARVEELYRKHSGGAKTGLDDL